MKTTSLAYTAAIAALIGTVATSCDDEEGSYILQTSAIKIASSHLDLKAQTDTAIVSISSAGAISVRTAQTWLTTAVDGNTVYAYATQNDSLYARAAKLVIYQNGDSAQVTVQQRGLSYTRDAVSADTVSYEGGTVSIRVKSNLDILFGTTPDWLTATLDGNNIVVSVAQNTTGYSRNSYISYTTGELADSFLIYQESGVVFEIAEDEFMFDIDGETLSTAYSSNFSIELLESPEWLTVEIGSEEITLTAPENKTGGPRIGIVVLHAGEVENTIVVGQDGGIVLRPEAEQYSFLWGETTTSIAVKHNFDVVIEEAPEWAEVSFDGTNLSINISDLENAKLRTGNIVLSSSVGDNTETATIELTQYFNILGNYKLFYYTGEKDDEDTELDYFSANISLDDDENLWLTLSSMGWKLPLLYDPDEGMIGFRSGQLMGTYNSYYITDIFFSSEGAWTGTSTNNLLTAEYSFDEDDVLAEFEGTFGTNNYSADCIFIEALSAPELTSENILGYLIKLWYPFLYKLPAE